VKLYSSFLNVDNGIVTIISKSFAGQTDRKEQWYETDYCVREIPRGTVERWRKCQSARNFKMDFPTQNKFIPSETSLQVKYPPNQSIKLRKSFEERMIAPVPPRIIREDGILFSFPSKESSSF
jgi:secreted Zn-dependent insulinase-like peptidase